MHFYAEVLSPLLTIAFAAAVCLTVVSFIVNRQAVQPKK